VILRTARYDDAREEVEFGEITIFLGTGFVITVRQGVASALHGARLRLEQHPELLEGGPASVLWANAEPEGGGRLQAAAFGLSTGGNES
jgi:magnesium transporter